MNKRKILFSNIGYARDINGALLQHVTRFGRHIYSPAQVQEKVMAQLKAIIAAEQPDICCLVEIEQGSFHSANFNQIQALMDDEYKFHDIANKYGQGNRVSRLPFLQSKSNAFLARHSYSFERLYFTHGTKRLVYRVAIDDDISLFFAHFSLNRKIRQKQFAEINKLARDSGKQVIIMADFNIMQGFKELECLLAGTNLKVMNKETDHTFIFYRKKLALDLCICSEGLAESAALKIIPQPFSDHAALLMEF